MLVILGIALLISTAVGVPFVTYCFKYQAKAKLSASAWQSKMKEIEMLRMAQLEQADTDEQIDFVNATYDTVAKNYKISRR
jgi:hypothetical protein